MNIITDTNYMLKALEEGFKGIRSEGAKYGSQIGAVLVSPTGEIISRGHNTTVNGIRRHAEEIVLSQAKTLMPNLNFNDTTLYVTIEPCNGNPYHKRRHCCEQITDYGVGRVVIAGRKFKFEGGLEHIQSHGIPIEILENKRLEHLCSALMYSNHGTNIMNSKSIRKLQKQLNEFKISFNPCSIL